MNKIKIRKKSWYKNNFVMKWTCLQRQYKYWQNFTDDKK